MNLPPGAGKAMGDAIDRAKHLVSGKNNNRMICEVTICYQEAGWEFPSPRNTAGSRHAGKPWSSDMVLFWKKLVQNYTDCYIHTDRIAKQNRRNKEKYNAIIEKTNTEIRKGWESLMALVRLSLKRCLFL